MAVLDDLTGETDDVEMGNRKLAERLAVAAPRQEIEAEFRGVGAVMGPI